MKLNLGCSDHHISGYVNVDICEPADRIIDLSSYPWCTMTPPAMLPEVIAESSIDEIRAHDIIEHLPNKIGTMNEAWRVLKPGGLLDIVVPTTDGRGAWQDPTHVSYWNRNSFFYFTHLDAHRERFGKAYGVEARFNVLYDEHTRNPGGDIIHLHIKLEAVK